MTPNSDFRGRNSKFQGEISTCSQTFFRKVYAEHICIYTRKRHVCLGNCNIKVNDFNFNVNILNPQST